MTPEIREAADRWLNDPAITDADKVEIKTLLDEGNDKELTERFYRELDFGTGGLRGIIGAGLNRVNVYTIGAAAQGLADHVATKGEAAKRAGVAIAFDSRRMSDVFAKRTACVMAGNGITAYLCEALRPTPLLSFAVRHLGCAAGVVITASHNPPEYNGFKVYGSDGGQVVPPDDGQIIERVRSVSSFGKIKAADFEQAKQKELIRMIGRDVDEAFLAEADAICLTPKISREQGKSLKIVYTSLHGSGGTLTPECLKRRGFQQVIEVPEQAKPDGDFPTVVQPNPEEGAALDLAIQLAKKETAQLVVGTDPDADRVGIAVPDHNGEFHLITGNQTAALIAWYICDQLTQQKRFPDNGVLLTTIVSGDMMKDIAKSYGAEVMETLTGFKWIGEKIRQFEEAGSPENPTKRFLFGAEESYGYMPGTYTRDKDAVTSTAVIADIAAVAADQGTSIYELLEDLYRRFGVYREAVKNLTLPGKDGAEKIAAMMNSMRQTPPTSLGGSRGKLFGDVKTGQRKHLITAERIEPYDLPRSNVLFFMTEDGTKAYVRPSGTEPKIKFYVMGRAADDDVNKAKQAAEQKVNAALDSLVALTK